MASHFWHWTSSGTSAVSNARPVASSSLGNTLAKTVFHTASLTTTPSLASNVRLVTGTSVAGSWRQEGNTTTLPVPDVYAATRCSLRGRRCISQVLRFGTQSASRQPGQRRSSSTGGHLKLPSHPLVPASGRLTESSVTSMRTWTSGRGGPPALATLIPPPTVGKACLPPSPARLITTAQVRQGEPQREMKSRDNGVT